MASRFPVVDFAPFVDVNSSDSDRAKTASDLTAACHRYGFVTITGHGLPAELLEKAFTMLHQLFDLPQEAKLKAPHPDGPVPHRGYSAPGLEKVYTKEQIHQDPATIRKISDFKESYEVGSESNRVQSNIWLPEYVFPGFRSFALDLFWRLNHLGETVLEAFALGLGLSKDERHYLTKEVRSGHNNQLRFLHYPPVPKAMVERDIIARMPAHTDWSLFTMLFQDSIGGLELEDPQSRGEFMQARPMGQALVLNIGDMFERITNGYFRSAVHRVTLPSPLTLGGENTFQMDETTPSRYSIPYFFAPDDDKVIRTLRSCVREGEASRYEDVRFEDYADLRAKHSYVNRDSTPSGPVQ